MILAETAGFCFGVRRAVDLAERTAALGKPCVTLGPIIHNRHVVEQLEALGVYAVDTPEAVPAGACVIIRSHGVGRAELAALEGRGATVVDATCPDVKKIHRIIAEAADLGRQVIVIGKRDHPEVMAACGWCENPLVLETAGELEAWILAEGNRERALTVVFQTTYLRENMRAAGEILKKWYTSAEIFDTICDATAKRQAEAALLAEQCDAMVVIGDPESANSRHLADICKQHCGTVVFVEGASLLSPDQFDGADTIGIIAGASTPAWIIKEVYETMSDEILKDTVEVEETPVQAIEEPAVVAPVEDPVSEEPAA
ncbi:MAG: 4-hydroxy-3-methylbut-2-enyl diphosphate reductase, partial [Oscillospiraceae bacterium]|nr:4-hydroxy-3-methylbut-2-enyl diphosphate reductase [Oscillospiraceae bacterium]